MNLAVVTPIPTPYRDPFWNAVASHPGVELRVFYCDSGKRDRPWDVNWCHGFDSEVLPGQNLAKLRGPDASCYWNPGLVGRLRTGGYDAVVVVGYNHPTMWLSMSWAQRNDVPFYLMSESHLRARRSVWKRCIKDIPVRRGIAKATGGFPTGELAERYLVHYGADPRSLTHIPNVPDVVALRHAAQQLRSTRTALRHKYGLDDRPTILFVGRLIPKKRADLLIRAVSRVCSDTGAQLVIVGDGTERDLLVRLAKERNISGSVHFAGFAQPSEMSKWYAMADLFVLPSSETWGVAVVEALASGLPVVVTDEVGCHPGVVVNSTVGTVIPARNERALASAIEDRLSFPTKPNEVELAWNGVYESMRYEVLADKFVRRISRRAAVKSPKAA